MIAQRAAVTALLIVTVTSAAFAEDAGLRACREQLYTADGATACFRALLVRNADPSVRAEALWGLGEVQEANQAFRVAARTMPDNADIRVRWGELFLAAHQLADAEALFTEALNLDAGNVDALQGLAEVAVSGFQGGAEAAVNRVLAILPGHPRANLLLAELALESQEVAEARALLTRVIEASGDRLVLLRAYALQSAADHIEGRLPSEWATRAIAMAPTYGDIFAIPAHYYVITRRYREAVELLEQAVAIDPGNYDARGELGINLLRLNRPVDARLQLEQAHALHGFDARVVNTLRLLDSLDQFVTYTSPTAVIRISPEEAAVLTPYAVDLIQRAQAEMEVRYQFKLQRPVVVELYRHHADFAVRTDGLPGIGILGASFGDVVVMNGPSAQSADDFDWVNALWHELAHVYTLNATENRVARWFSEGVSVLEEWRHGPTARSSVSLHFIDAYAAGQLLPIARLDDGFMRPTYDGQIEVSYVQAGLVCQFIDERFEGGLVKVLRAYAAGAPTAEAIRTGLGVDAEVLDSQFGGYLAERFGQLVADLAGYKGHLVAAVEALEADHWDDAIAAARLAIERYPEYVGDDNPYLLLARAASKAENTVLAKQTLDQYWHRGGRNMAALDELAGFLVADGNIDANIDAVLPVLRVLARAEPLVLRRHVVMGDLLAELARWQEALTEYEAVLALKPFDLAAAQFKVAEALHQLHRTREARRAVLQSLEIAPRYRPALSLLVELNK